MIARDVTSHDNSYCISLSNYFAAPEVVATVLNADQFKRRDHTWVAETEKYAAGWMGLSENGDDLAYEARLERGRRLPLVLLKSIGMSVLQRDGSALEECITQRFTIVMFGTLRIDGWGARVG